MQRLLQSVAKAIARQTRGLLERKAPVRESTRVWSEPRGRITVGFRARAAPVGAVQKSRVRGPRSKLRPPRKRGNDGLKFSCHGRRPVGGAGLIVQRSGSRRRRYVGDQPCWARSKGDRVRPPLFEGRARAHGTKRAERRAEVVALGEIGTVALQALQHRWGWCRADVSS
jgi:hypothetical protein